MGIRKCIVPDCPSTSARLEDRGVTYHKIPYLDDMKRLWITACHLPDDYFATKGSNVCSRHFRKADFQEFKGKKYVLKFGVVPTIFEWTIAKPSADDATTTKSTPKASKGKDETAKGQKADKSKEEVPHEVGDKDDNIVLKEDVKVTALMKNEQAQKTAATPAKRKSTPSSAKRSSTGKKASTTPVKQARVEPVASPSKKQTPKKGSAESKQSVASETPTVAAVDEPEPSGGTSDKAIDFTPGTKIEAQDFSGTWHAAKLLEVDTEDREVLVQFDKTDKIKSTIQEEWISMDSVRLRPISNTTYSVGEKVFARWSDSRKFKATIKSIVENNMYEVVFDDGFAKICKSSHISRIKRSEEAKTEPVEKEQDVGGGVIVPDVTIKTEPIGQGEGAEAGASALLSLNQLRIEQVVKLSELPEIPQAGEWCCHWMNDYPVGEPSEVDLPGGRVYTVIVPDWRMPEGWIKHIFQRITTYGKMDILLVSPSGKVLRSRQEVKTYLEEIGETYDPNKYDFGLHMKRAKQLGCIHYTQEYKDSFLPKPANEPLLLNTEVNIGSVKVKIIDNLFQCPEADCLKTFRKENHLQIHIKHYHKELAKGLGDIPCMQDLAALRTPIELLESPKAVSRKSHAPATPKTPAQPIVVKEEKMDEDEMVPPPAEPVAAESTTTVVESKPAKEDLLKSPKEMKQEIDSKPFTDKPETKVSLDPEPSVVQDTAAEVSVPSTSTAATPTSTKSKPPSKVTKIKLFTQKKTPGDVKKIRHGLVTKKKSSRSKKSRSRSRPSKRARVVANRSAPVVRPTDTTLGSYSFANYSGAFQNEMSGGFYDESINASVGGPATGLVDENGEVIKIVRMRKEEIINCVCKVTEEDGLMVQCEMCLCWQHAFCQNIRNSSEVPDTYVCSICRYPYMGRASKRYAHDQDWLYEGKLPVAKYHASNSKHAQRFDILKNSHTLTGNLLELKRFMHSLQMKINIAEKKDHPKMYLWSKKWEKSPPRGDGSSSMAPVVDKQQPHGADGGDQQQIPHIPVPEAPIDPAECQAILLDHIQKQQNDAMGRLQAIEAQIIGLEAYDEKADLLESPTAKNYPKTKQTIHMLLNDLLKMKKIAEIHSDLQSLTM
uniref:MBD domain-containing protein n=1 Tax=Anopheles culicifacies TaxID=139723 RepID=A0A182LSN2_9DIPT